MQLREETKEEIALGIPVLVFPVETSVRKRALPVSVLRVVAVLSC